jgi:hypothetical protein
MLRYSAVSSRSVLFCRRRDIRADFVGATCEGVVKILAEWRVLGWVAQSRGTLRIVDRPVPDAIAHADIN